jgi:hypothetical protein
MLIFKGFKKINFFFFGLFSRVLIEQLQSKVQSLEKLNGETCNELTQAKNTIIELNNEINKLKEDKETADFDYQKKISVKDFISFLFRK